MPYVVDGNNVMAQIVGWHRDKPAARKRLIREAVRFMAATRAKVTLVFDGRPDDEFPEGTKYKSVRILYSRPGEDADSRIIELVRVSRAKRDLIVVTSDRELASRARSEGAQVIPSGEFRTKLAEAERGEPEKPETDDIDHWLALFGSREQ
ncbi:MAG: NYN domain-containing protein [Desulfomonile sp.]|nr:NYN domain-containing protein [Desulfomonile sp.]